jgi:adenosylmethionine-8-amino-7-oxononanoate aminotransferase
VDGVRGDHILLAPPYIITPDEIALAVDRLGDAIDDALSGISH